MDYWNQYGLLNSERKPPNIIDENCPLYTLTHHLLQKITNYNIALDLKKHIRKYINELEADNGFCDNIVGIGTGEDAYTSHDQLRTICVYSKLYNHNYHSKIWDKMKANWFTYDNLKGSTNFKRLVHPRDVIFIGHLNGNWLCELLMPFYFLMVAVTFAGNKKTRPTIGDSLKHLLTFHTWPFRNSVSKTDGEILFWIESQIIKPSWLKALVVRYANYRVQKRFGGWHKVFGTYYRDPEHPINMVCCQAKPSQLTIK